MFKGPLLKPSEKAAANGALPRRSNGHSRTMAKVSRYEILKDKIKTWYADRFKAGEALLEIQRDKLYKDEYPTFEEMCSAEFGMQRAHAYRLIEAVDVKASVTALSPVGDTIRNERQARALAPVPVEKRVEVMEAVVEQGPVTAKAITETAARVTRPTPAPRPAPAPTKVEPEKHYDKTGYLIPDSIWEDWQRAEDFGMYLRQLSEIKKVVSDGLDDSDPIFRELNNGAVSMLKNIYGELKCVIPYAVCSTCQGRTPEKCALCKGRGFLSSFAWNQFAPAKIKEMRKKMTEKK